MSYKLACMLVSPCQAKAKGLTPIVGANWAGRSYTVDQTLAGREVAFARGRRDVAAGCHVA